MNFKENSDVNVIEQDVKYDVSYADTNEDKHDIQQTEALTSKLELHEDKPQPVVDNSNQFDSVEKVAAPNVAKLRDPAICGLFNRSSVNFQSDCRRTERLLNKSVCKEVAASAEPSSTSVACPKSPSTRRPQSSTIPSPFRFRSEERVAKRKEIFGIEELSLRFSSPRVFLL